MRTGVFVLALATAAAVGAGAVVLLAGAEPPGSGPSASPGLDSSDGPDGDSRSLLSAAIVERDEARAEAVALRQELERERAGRRAAGRSPGISGLWFHSVDDRRPVPLEFRANGEAISAGKERVRWSLEGKILRMSWPDEAAPGGAWEEVCILDDDGATYTGRNQQGHIIKGTREPE